MTGEVRYRGLGQTDCSGERLVIPGWLIVARDPSGLGGPHAIRGRGPEPLLQLNVTSAVPERQLSYSDHTSSS
jgi:hypothetical protein